MGNAPVCAEQNTYRGQKLCQMGQENKTPSSSVSLHSSLFRSWRGMLSIGFNSFWIYIPEFAQHCTLLQPGPKSLFLSPPALR